MFVNTGLRSITVVSMMALLSGCGAHFNSIYRNSELNSSDRLVSTDAKQRGIIRQRRGISGQLVTCFEPSPDAYSVLAATASGNADVIGKVTTAFSGSSGEAGANIGLRTQTITVLRDQGFRACEAFANEGIQKEDYQQLLRRNQILSTATLAIEQLTGAVAGASTAIAAGGTLEVDQDAIAKATEQVAAATEAVKAAEGALTNAKTAKNNQQAVIDSEQADVEAAEEELNKLPPQSPDRAQKQATLDAANASLSTEQGKLPPLEANIITRQSQLDGKMETLGVYQAALRDAKVPNQQIRTSAMTTGAEVRAAIPGVASAVENIVELAFTKTHLIEFCQTLWSGTITKANPSADAICDRVMAQFEHTIDHETHANFGRDADSARGNAGPEIEAGEGAEGSSSLRRFGQPRIN